LIKAYFDSSAIFKLGCEEKETFALIEFLEEGAVEASTSVLAEVEVTRNLRHRQLDQAEAVRGFHLITVDEDIRRAAIELGDRTLKSLDAIHIATALAIGDRDLQFITYDNRQADAARQAGLKVIQPGR
jgi:predicted nucleic acid-binding protein